LIQSGRSGIYLKPVKVDPLGTPFGRTGLLVRSLRVLRALGGLIGAKWVYDQEQTCGYSKRRTSQSLRQRKPSAYKNAGAALLAHAQHATQRLAEPMTTEDQ